MGLDQYAFAVEEGAVDGDGKPMDVREELRYWRKHPNLQGWMERLWFEKGQPVQDGFEGDRGCFNCIDLYLNARDIERLKEDVISGSLPETEGFFFGSASDEEYKNDDLIFCSRAKEALDEGLAVYYTSWW